MTEQAKVPEIRFAGFTDPWEQRKLGDVTDSFSGGTPDGSHASYYGGSIPFIRSAEINSDKTELFLTEKGLDNSSAKIVERGTVLYALYGATSGEVGIAAIKGAINQAILALSPHTGNDPLFLASWLRREKARIVDTYLQGGQGNLSGSIVKELSFALPQQKEQQVIGSFFSHLDNLITLHQRKYDKLVVFKKSMLEKMFPKDGESVPEIRFAGFTDPWEQRKFSELASLRRGLTYSPADIRPYGQGIRVLRSSNIDEDEFTLSNEDVFVDETVVGIELVQEGEILITAANGSPRLVGKRAIINGLTGKTVHGGFMLCAHAEQPDYVAALMGSRWYQHFLATGVAGGNGSIGNLDKAALEDEFAFVPSIEEQELIGVLFSRLDDLITLHQRNWNCCRISRNPCLTRCSCEGRNRHGTIRYREARLISRE